MDPLISKAITALIILCGVGFGLWTVRSSSTKRGGSEGGSFDFNDTESSHPHDGHDGGGASSHDGGGSFDGGGGHD